MSASFSNLPDRILFSSELDDVSLSTDAQSVDVTVVISPGDADPVFAQTLWPYAGKVTLPLADILQTRMRERAAAGRTPELFTLSLSVRDHVQDIPLISRQVRAICMPDTSPAIPPEEFLESEFLTPSRIRRFPPGMAHTLYALLSPGHALTPEIRYVAAATDGTQWASRMFLDDIPAPADYTVKSFRINPADILRYAALNDEQGYYPADSLSLLSATLRVGPRQATVFYDPTLDPSERFDFRNRFLAPESLFADSPPRRTLEFRRSFASLSHRSVPYGPTCIEAFRSRVPAVTPEEFSFLSDLLDSPLVTRPLWRYEDDFTTQEEEPLVITEAEPVYGPEEEEPPVAEITWRFCDDRRQLTVPDRRSRFTDQYDSTFF